jgi:CCR4-NOT transcription complex subunit 6
MGDYSWHLSLRIDQPIEGCEISPHAYVKIQSITMDNSSKAKVLDSHPHTFVYRWSRSPNVQSCCNNGCSRQNSNDPMFWSSFARGGPILQCAVCEKAGLPKYQALFCSTS